MHGIHDDLNCMNHNNHGLTEKVIVCILFFEKLPGESVINSSFCAGNSQHLEKSLPIAQFAK